NTGSFPANPNRLGSLLNSNILSLFEDFSGNLWIGHQGQGISILNLHKKEFDTYRHDPSDNNSLISNTIMCFNGNNEDILIGCRIGGINILPKNRKLAEVEGFRRAMLISPVGVAPFVHGVWDIAKVTDDLFLVGSFEGVFELKKASDKWEVRLFSDQELFSQSCRKIFVDENKNVWFGFLNHGLVFVPNLPVNGDRIYYQFRYDENDENSLSDNELISMLVDSNGRFWIGTVNGLNLVTMEYHNLDLSGKVQTEIRFKRFVSDRLEKNYLNNNEINCIFENYNGQLWIATQGGGINIFDPASSSFTYLTQEHGLPTNDVQGILRDETGTLWISTNNGLVSYNQHVSDPKFHLYSFQDGIQGSVFMVNSFFKSMDGEMFFGGDNGFTRFYPRNIHPNTVPPKMVLTDMKIYNRVIGIGDTIYKQNVLEKCLNETSSIKLPFRDRVFSIGVSSIHYQYPLGNYITFKLEGYDKEWNVMPASSKFIEYSNLPFGDYTLKAIAYSSDNIPSVEPRELQIIIDPPWYLRWYVIVVFSLIGLTVLVGFILILVNRQKLSY
ncbi:MAG: hypothetical protein IH594_17845, partial [Bacteroidales bacterium]|nr:hypothetical protein [Bacteroidales bacterium]